jgi:thiaminase/transcriptional activator TenA
MLHNLLWVSNADLVERCRAHPFVRGLEQATLPLAAFRRYVAQDAFFLRSFVRAYSVVLARAPDAAAPRLLRFIEGALRELELHASYARQLGIDLATVRPYAATSAYTEFLLATAWHSDAGRTLAAMTPCMRLYAHLGQALAPANHPEHPYAEWITTYASREFDELARQVEQLLDELATDTPAVRDAYRYALQCELDFFSAPLEEPA